MSQNNVQFIPRTYSIKGYSKKNSTVRKVLRALLYMLLVLGIAAIVTLFIIM